jgi:thymidylate synthase
MKEIRRLTLEETWLSLLREIDRSGQPVGNETRELLNVWAAFERGEFRDGPLLVRSGAGLVVDEMRKVFFGDEPNLFGHSYRSRFCGPQGRSDLSDVIELLRSRPVSKRALVTLIPCGDGTVPCINAVQFLCREDGLLATYFSRGQDIFRKFYADAVCVYEMARQVASGLGTRVCLVSGAISSAHVYLADSDEIRCLLAEASSVSPQLVPNEEAA